MIAPGAVIVGSGAGETVTVLLPLMVRLHASVNVHVSVRVPPQPLIVPVLVAGSVPDIKQPPVAELV